MRVLDQTHFDTLVINGLNLTMNHNCTACGAPLWVFPIIVHVGAGGDVVALHYECVLPFTIELRLDLLGSP